MFTQSASKNTKINKILCQRLNEDILSKYWKRNNPKNGNLPIGVTNFVDLVTKHRQFYVEKARFVKQFLDLVDTGMKMIVITRPSGWGKSVNLSMLKYFFNREVDKNGIVLNPQPYKNIFLGGSFNIKDGRNQRQVQLAPLKIIDNKNYTNPSFIRTFQGTCPVIFLDFSSINCTNVIQLKKGLLDVISYSYQSHNYLRNTQKSVAYNNYRRQIARISQLLPQQFMKQPLDSFIKGLDSLLENFHRCDYNKCFILIDDCDSPVYKILKSTNNLIEARRAAQLIASILIPINNQSKYLKIVATGQTNIFQTCLKGYKHFGISQYKFYEQFGFHDKQIQKNILQPLLCRSNTDAKRIIQFFLRKIINNYGGYVCNMIAPCKIEPYSAIRYLHLCMASSQLLNCQFKKDQFQQGWCLQNFITLSGFPKLFSYQSLDQIYSENKHMQALYPMQYYISANNQNLLSPQINNFCYSIGFITGIQQHIGKWKISEPKIPNNSVANIIGSAVINIFREVFQFDDFGLIDLKSIEDVCTQFEKMLTYFYSKQIQINTTFISGAFYYRYRYSTVQNKFITAYQLIQSGKIGMIDNVYVPCDNHDQIMIYNFYYIDVNETKQNIVAEIIYQTIESNLFERALQAGKLIGEQIQQYVLRLILVMPDITMTQLQVSPVIQQHIFSVKQIENIVNNMLNEKIKEEWHKMRRLGTLKKGKQSLSILNILSSQKMHENIILEQLVDLQAHKKQRRFDLHGIKGPLSRNIRPKKIQKPNQ